MVAKYLHSSHPTLKHLVFKECRISVPHETARKCVALQSSKATSGVFDIPNDFEVSVCLRTCSALQRIVCQTMSGKVKPILAAETS